MTSRTPLIHALRRLFRALQPGSTFQSPEHPADFNLTRRRVLKVGAATGGLLLARDIPVGKLSAAQQPSIAIVGGGLAGLTAAYRLSRRGLRPVLFEAADRFGGRVRTRTGFNAEGMFVEEGAEFIDSSHKEIFELADELGVSLQNVRRRDKGIPLFHLAGKNLTENEIAAAFEPLAERIAAAAENIYDDNDEPTEQGRQLDATPLSDWLQSNSGGIEEGMLRLVEIACVSEFGAELSEQSSLNLIEYFGGATDEFFSPGDESWRLEGGNSKLCGTLLQAIENRVQLKTTHRLTGIARDEQGLRLRIEQGQDRAPVEERFDRAILAIPFNQLRTVEGIDNIGLDEGKLRVIRELAHGKNTKAMLGFRDRHWRELDPVANGSAYTDTGLQCCWETSRGQEGSSGILTCFLGGRAAESLDLIELSKLPEQLSALFPGLAEKFNPTEAHFVKWSRENLFGMSYSLAGPGQYLNSFRIAAEPALGGILSFAGEQTSDAFAGYMNGAVESGNRAALEMLTGLDEPAQPLPPTENDASTEGD